MEQRRSSLLILTRGLLPLFFSFCLFCPTVLAANDAVSSQILSFRDFCQKVLAYYPKLKQQDVNVNLAIARKLQAVSGFLPRVQGITSVTRGDDPVFVFGSLLREEAFTSANFDLGRLNSPRSHTTYNASLEAQMPIFDAFQTISRVRSAKLQIDAARYDSELTKMEASLVAAEAYVRAVSVEKLLAIVTEVSEASRRDIEQAQELKDKGLILGADFFTAKVMFGNIEQMKNQLGRETQAAHILLNILMGEDSFNSFTLPADLTEEFPDDKTLVSWFSGAYQARPDLLALDKTIAAQEVEVSREKSTALPRVDAFGEARTDTRKLTVGGGQNYLVGVKAEMDLFDPAHSSRVKISKETLKKLEYDKTILKDKIAQDLTNEFTHYQTTRANMPVMHAMLDDSKQAIDLMIPLYREGRKSIADVLQTRSCCLNVAKGYYTLLADAKASWTRLLFLSGQITEPAVRGMMKKGE